jgi:hypothetical protein
VAVPHTKTTLPFASPACDQTAIRRFAGIRAVEFQPNDLDATENTTTIERRAVSLYPRRLKFVEAIAAREARVVEEERYQS